MTHPAPDDARGTWRTAVAQSAAASLSRRSQELDPYRLLRQLTVDTRGSSPADRAAYAMRSYSWFVALLVDQVQADREALMHVGTKLFGVSKRTMRADLARAEAARKARPEQTTAT